jgi:hypothetical protein
MQHIHDLPLPLSQLHPTILEALEKIILRCYVSPRCSDSGAGVVCPETL